MSESPAFLLLYSSVFFSGAKEERSNSSFGWEPRLSIIISWKGPWVPVTVVMPLNAPIMKISACRKHGATVHVNGADLIEV